MGSLGRAYKVSYREYVHNQVTKDTTTYSLKNAISRSKVFEQLDPGWKSVILAHYGAITMPEYLASIGEARMGRFGRAAAWRNTAKFGTLDEVRHGQIQAFFPYGLLPKEPRGDWALKAFHTDNWIILAVRHLFDDMFVANDALSVAIQLTFTLETGFTNLQFLGMAADAIDVGDLEFGALISSIQTDQARHAQQGEPTIKVLIDNGHKEYGQFLIEHMFWRSWRAFALLTGLSMDYYTPLEARKMSFKEFIQDWVVKQFAEQFRDYGLDFPWYWDESIDELNWYHHAIHTIIWNYRPSVWWNPDAGVSPAEREWLEEKYPGWNRVFGRHWDELWEGDIAEVAVGSDVILLAHLPGSEVRAYQGLCPHAEYPLASGELAGTVLTCAGHLWEFDLSTGKGVNPPDCQLYEYPVRLSGDQVCVSIPEDGKPHYNRCRADENKG